MGAFSVNTNETAFIALQSLTQTIKRLEKTQLNITTGLRINGPKADAATFSIAQNHRGDIAGFTAVKIAPSSGEATVDVAITAGKSISNLLIEMKAKVIQANQARLDSNSLSALNNDFAALRDQITTIVQTAEFSGANLITSGATDLSVLSTVDGSTIVASAQIMDTATLGISATDLTSSASASLALTAIDNAITTVSFKLANLGSSSKRIEVQSDFTVQLVDILKVGVGNLVDANLAEESADLQSPQVKQQLGIQALSIANTNPQSILALFQ